MGIDGGDCGVLTTLQVLHMPRTWRHSQNSYGGGAWQ